MVDYEILVNTCDAYEDLWNPFFTLFKKYWVQYDGKIYVSTEKKKIKFDGLNIVTVNFQYGNKDVWGKRFKNALELIEKEYVIVMLDDFFIRTKVNYNKINDCCEYLKNNMDVACFYFLDTGPLFRNQFVDDQRFYGFEKAKSNAWYKLNLQAAIWRKKDLISFVNEHDTPWSWEMLGSKYLKTEKSFYFLKSSEERIIEYGYKLDGMGVFRGKWVKEDVVPLFNREEISVDFSERGFYKANKNFLVLIKNRLNLKLKLMRHEWKYYKN